jgi:hypothetical protein
LRRDLRRFFFGSKKSNHQIKAKSGEFNKLIACVEQFSGIEVE